MSSLLVQPASAMPPPYVWDAVPDFKANPSLNPGPDQYGNLGVWSYVTTPGSSGAGTPLPTYAANAVPGVIAAWYQVNPGYNLPTVAINYSASTYFNGVSANIPNNVVLMHPYAKKAAVLRWKSPVKARVCIKVTAEDLDPGSGDGVRVYVRKGNGGPLL